MSSRTIFHSAAIASILAFCGAPLTEAETQTTLEPFMLKAREAVKAMGGKLQGELKAAIASGGPVSAVQVCKTVAPAIAEQQSKASGLTVKRTSLKVRNPSNAPDALERRVLEDFATKVQAGSDPATLEYIEQVADGERTLVRYFKAIPTAKEPCLACHGSDVSGELKETISKLYPDDQATGFKAGDLRGAFSVTMEKK
ncbi:MAG: DUF3365 domain-containing protein [Hyphomicrobium sp.]